MLNCIMSKKGRPSPVDVDRYHFVPEWAAHRGMRRADLVEMLDTTPSTVGRWWKGAPPTPHYLTLLAEIFKTTVPALFRPPEYEPVFSALERATPDRRAEMLRLMAFIAREDTNLVMAAKLLDAMA